MLLAVEGRVGSAGVRSSKFNFLGGKRDTVDEAPRGVAARECWEETGEQLSAAARLAIETAATPVAWAAQS
eukprot:4907499-Prymnesium_polylepis.1